MEIDILATEMNEINFAPRNEVEEIIQNVKTICTTPKYSVPLDREFGINVDALDMPTPKAQAMIQAEIIQAVKKFEPRCRVKKVSFEEDLDGHLNYVVRIAINDEE